MDPFAKSAIDPFAKSAIDPFAKSAIDPFAKSAIDPLSGIFLPRTLFTDGSRAFRKALNGFGAPPRMFPNDGF